MLRAMDRIMEDEKPLGQGNPRLERAHREGVHYWRDHFGRVAMKEFYHQIRSGKMFGGGKLLLQLLWYTRGETLAIPWRYRRRAFRMIRGRFRICAHENE